MRTTYGFHITTTTAAAVWTRSPLAKESFHAGNRPVTVIFLLLLHITNYLQSVPALQQNTNTLLKVELVH